MTYDPASCPDWVLLGVPAGDGLVVIYASKDLTRAELAREVDPEDFFLFRRDPYLAPLCRFTLYVEMRQYVMVAGSSYLDALRRLFEAWSPVPEPDQPAVGGRRAIQGPEVHR